MKTKITALFMLILAAFISLNAQSIGTGNSEHTIVTKSDGTVYTWGYNGYGQLGNGNTGTGSNNVPVAVYTSGVLNGKTITQVADGYGHSIALASDGTVYTWGYNDYGQLGNGITGTDSNVPVAVNTSGVLSGKTITQVASGSYHSIALASDGKVYTWGYNNHGQLGTGNTTTSNVPVAVDASVVLSGKTITQAAAGQYHSIALASDGKVYTWGYNSNGQLGNGNNTTSNVPVAVITSGVLIGKTITKVAAGASHSIALASDGTVYTWGYNGYGQLGNGDNTRRNVPVAVSTSVVLSGKTITQVAAGGHHSIALASDEKVYPWGYNSKGQLGNGNNTNSNVPVAVDQSGMGALPVELTSFTAAPTSSATVVLNWQTATEVNNYGFEIQRAVVSGQLSEWEKVGFVNGHGNSNSSKQYSFTDNLLDLNLNLNLNYRLKQIDIDGNFEYSDVVEVKVETPTQFKLAQNYPNPFNPETKIRYSIPLVETHSSAAAQNVFLKVYDVLGNEVATLVNEEKPAGVYEVNFDASKLSSGIYLYKLQAVDPESSSGQGFVQTNKMMLLK